MAIGDCATVTTMMFIKILTTSVAFAASTRVSALPMSIIPGMMLPESMNDSKLGKASLFPLSINEIVEEKGATTGSKVISSHTGEYGSLCFVVRRPG